MKRFACFVSCSIAMAALGLSQASAQVIAADDFNDADGTAVNGKAADVGNGNWSAPGGQSINGGILDTAMVGEHQGSFLSFTQPLAAGQTLTMNFTSAESAKTTFLGGGAYAGISFFIDDSEKVFVGDPGGGQPVNGWALDGFAFPGPQSSQYTGLANEVVSGTFTYSFDTGAATLSVTDGATVMSTTHTYLSGLALNRIRIQSGSDANAGIAVNSFSVSAVVPEPTSLGIMLAGVAGLVRRSRK